MYTHAMWYRRTHRALIAGPAARHAIATGTALASTLDIPELPQGCKSVHAIAHCQDPTAVGIYSRWHDAKVHVTLLQGGLNPMAVFHRQSEKGKGVFVSSNQSVIVSSAASPQGMWITLFATALNLLMDSLAK